MVKIAFFDTKPYDLPEFEKQGRECGIEFKFLEPRLDSDTVSLARGCDGVCAFVNDTVDAHVIDALAADGIGLVAMRCSGYNNVDLARARG